METESDARRRRRARERAIAELAGRQHGVVSIRQLRRLGLGNGAIRQRLGRGHLSPVHRGVYAVGHPAVSSRGRWLAAVLAFEGAAVLSHRSAAALWGLLPDDSERLHVIASQRFRSTAEIRAHCCSLAPIEVTDRLGIPVSSLARTLIDVAGTAPHLLERACNEAEVKRLITAEQISATIEINRGRRGVARLRALAETVDGAPPRSELERRFLALVAREGLPRPETGVLIEIGNQLLECDCVWREQRLIVELDGRKYHDTAIAFERDRVRDRLLLAAGWHVVRVTWSQVRDAGALLADLRRLLRHRRTQH